MQEKKQRGRYDLKKCLLLKSFSYLLGKGISNGKITDARIQDHALAIQWRRHHHDDARSLYGNRSFLLFCLQLTVAENAYCVA